MEELRRTGLEEGLVVDLGCGSGILSGVVSEAGYDVLGIDVSEAMVAMAGEVCRRGRFGWSRCCRRICHGASGGGGGGGMSELPLRPEQHHDQPGQAFPARARCIEPGGLFVLDVAEPGRTSHAARACAESEEWAVLATSEEDAERRILTRRITTFRRVGELFRPIARFIVSA